MHSGNIRQLLASRRDVCVNRETAVLSNYCKLAPHDKSKKLETKYPSLLPLLWQFSCAKCVHAEWCFSLTDLLQWSHSLMQAKSVNSKGRKRNCCMYTLFYQTILRSRSESSCSLLFPLLFHLSPTYSFSLLPITVVIIIMIIIVTYVSTCLAAQLFLLKKIKGQRIDDRSMRLYDVALQTFSLWS